MLVLNIWTFDFVLSRPRRQFGHKVSEIPEKYLEFGRQIHSSGGMKSYYTYLKLSHFEISKIHSITLRTQTLIEYPKT